MNLKTKPINISQAALPPNMSQTGSLQTSLSQKIIAASLALFIGMALIYGTGMVQNIAVHNGAHDMRHAFGFPCH